MQQAATKTFQLNGRRRLLLSFTILLSLISLAAIYIGYNYQRLTLVVANHFLQPYQIQLQQLEFEVQSLRHWQLPHVSLTVNNSDIKIEQLAISFKDNSNFLALSIKDLQSLAARNVNVALDGNILRQSSSAKSESGPAVALDLTALPHIEISNIHLALKGIDPDRFALQLTELLIDKDGRFNSSISYNQQPILALQANLLPQQWQTQTQIDLTALQRFISAAAAAEKTLFPTSDLDVSAARTPPSSLLSPLYELQATLASQQVALNGQLNSTMTLDLKSAQLQSTHQLTQFEMKLTGLAGLTLSPASIKNTTSISTAEQKLVTDKAQLNFNLDGHLAELQLTIQPFTLALSPSQPQLAVILKQLDDIALEKALSNLYQSLTNQQDNQEETPSLQLTVNAPVIYKLGEKSVHSDQIALDLLQSKLAATVQLTALSYNVPTAIANTLTTANDGQLSFNWQLAANHQQTIRLNSLWPTLAALPFDIAIDHATLALHGEFSTGVNQGQAEYHLKLQPQAMQLTQGIRLSNKVADTPQPQAALKLNIAKTELALTSAAEYHFSNGASVITLPAINYAVSDLSLTQHNNDPLQTHYQFNMAAANIALQAPISLSLAANTQPVIEQLLQQSQSNQLDWTFEQVILDKSANRVPNKKQQRRTTEKLLNLATMHLQQSLQLKSAELNTREDWWLNDINLSSQHRYSPRQNQLSDFTLNGDWQFSSPFAPMLAFLSQTDSLPESIELNGNAELELHYQLKREHDTLFALSFKPKVSDIQGSVNNLPFEGGFLTTECRYQWQNKQRINSNSHFRCDNIKLALQAFNPGVLITDIDAEAALSFSTDSSVSAAIQNDEASNLALAAEIFGIEQASVNLTAKGDLLDGQLLIPQFQLNLKQPSSAYFVLQHINLAKLLEIQPQVGIYADGIFDGVLPVFIQDGQASIKGGQLAARAPGGLIAISGNPAVDQMRLSQPYLEFAFSALEHLQYSQLSSSFDMDTLGDAILKVNVKGRSRGMERPIHLNYSQEENMLQLLKSLQIGDNLQNQIEKSIQQ